MAPQHSNYWVAVFQTQNRGYGETRLCPCIVLGWLLRHPLSSAPNRHPSLRRLLSTLLLLPVKLRRPYITGLLLVNPLLLPPPPRNPGYRPPNRSLTEIQNCSRQNISRDCIMPPCDVYPDLLKTCFLHRC